MNIKKLQSIADDILGSGVVTVSLEERRQVVNEMVEKDGRTQPQPILGDDGEPVMCTMQSIRVKAGRGVSVAFDLTRGKGDHRVDLRTPLTDEEIVEELGRQLGNFAAEHADRQLRDEIGHEEFEKLTLSRRRAALAEAAKINRAKALEMQRTQAEHDAKSERHVILAIEHAVLLEKAVAQGVLTREQADAKMAERRAMLAAKQAKDE